MSCNYADGLSPYENKGVLGTPEKFDDIAAVEWKCAYLVELIKNAKHVVLHTGAGISTSAGIPDFRSPNGVWTLQKQGKKPNLDISFCDAIPTVTHMAIKKLIDENYIHYVVSQNIDGLHLRTGIPRRYIAELHGNMFVEQCGYCESNFVRSTPTSTVGKKCLEQNCRRSVRGRSCRGKLYDTILDWEHSLPDKDLEMSDYHSSLADLNICLGTTLQIVPSGNLPLRNKKYGGKLIIINLQPTKHDKKADLIINTYVDDVLIKIMKRLNLEIPIYSEHTDPTKRIIISDWNIQKSYIKEMKAKYDDKCKIFKKRKSEETELQNKKKLEKIDLTLDDGIKEDSEKLDEKGTIDLTLSDEDEAKDDIKKECKNIISQLKSTKNDIEEIEIVDRKKKIKRKIQKDDINLKKLNVEVCISEGLILKKIEVNPNIG